MTKIMSDMNIVEALRMLVRTHICDDGQAGYTVECPPCINDEESAAYVAAWGVVRDHLRHGDGTCNVCGERLALGCCNPAKAVLPVENGGRGAAEIDIAGVKAEVLGVNAAARAASMVYRDAALHGVGCAIIRGDGTIVHVAREDFLAHPNLSDLEENNDR